ncbi:MAG: L,D-transpeptidase family protein [Lachnospiraceae bacterium]|nr:L,D-transpeptidase family protein [Lachnospiraceae bacterium]
MDKRKQLLKRVAVFGKKHHIPMNIIIFEFAVIILAGHFKDYLRKKRVGISFACAVMIVLCSLVTGSSVPVKPVLANAGGTEESSEYKELTTEEPTTEETYDKILNEEEINEFFDSLNIKEEEIKADAYYIRVNRLKNCITVYTLDENGNYDEPVKAMVCSTGGERTPLGVYRTSNKYVMRNLLFNVYGQYATRIVGQILFHSSSNSTDQKDSLLAEEFNKLGLPVSHGCIRLTVRDSKWIYDNCKEGTIVEIYEDEYEGPLGKPEMIKVPLDTVWDPTDPDEANPWNKCEPLISGVKDREVEFGSYFSSMYGVSAVDTCGNNITNRIKIYGHVDTGKKGKYMLVYYVEDLIGKTDIKTAIYTVK